MLIKGKMENPEDMTSAMTLSTKNGKVTTESIYM